MMLKCLSLLILSCALIIGVSSCSSTKGRYKQAPVYDAMPEELRPYVQEFFALSEQNDIDFSNEVSIGMTKINRSAAIGVCSYGNDWREVDIDSEYWANADELSKKALVFHELIHCYCTRGHDYEKDKNYPEVISILINSLREYIPWTAKEPKPGYFPDSCPTSLMHPTLVSSYCLQLHWDHYTKEMFDRCEPF